MLSLSVLALAVSAAPALSQERTPASPVTPLKVQVVLSRYDGEKKLSSMPYTLLVNAGDRDNRVTLRMGVSLPVTGVGASGPTVTVHDIGTNMDCTASPADGGRFRISLAVNHSSVFETDQSTFRRPFPARRQRSAHSIVHVEFSLLCAITKPASRSPKSVTGEVMRIDVTVRS
jgi:hypothetical protein